MKNNNEQNNKYFNIGITIFVVVLASLIAYFLFKNISLVLNIIKGIFSALISVVVGAFLTYMFSPFYNKLKEKLLNFFDKKRHPNPQKKFYVSNEKLSKSISTFVSVLIVFALIFGFFRLILPGFISSIKELINTLPQYSNNVDGFISKFHLENYSDFIHEHYEDAVAFINQQVSKITSNYDETALISNIFSGVYSFLKNIMNFLIGIIVMIYLLNFKEVILAQIRKFIIAVFSEDVSKKIFTECKFINSIFYGFIIGKIVDSIIIGILCFICVSLMKMPYPIVLATIVGVTNVIPFFGPFLGAIPCIILIFLINPIQSLYFAIFILILQQFDGNILGPMILGDKTGVSPFYVLLSILLFGYLFGFIGMIIAVPLWAIIQHFISQYCNTLLTEKNMPTDSSYYSKENMDKFFDNK